MPAGNALREFPEDEDAGHMPTDFVLLGVGAMNSPRYRPAGLLIASRRHRVMLDGGGTAVPRPPLDAWLVSDKRAELMPDIRRRCKTFSLNPAVAEFTATDVDEVQRITPLPVVHTSHRTYGYLINCGQYRVVWAPEFWEFPVWAQGADLMFADAAGWLRPIRFAKGAGGHAAVHDTAERARRAGVRRLIFAHIGRPSIRAMDAGEQPPYGEWGIEGNAYRPESASLRRAADGGPVHGSRADHRQATSDRIPENQHHP
ncbi:MAG TPA: MBL fold metallo-hydrolase [Streptosporangiaceae bacterium]